MYILITSIVGQVYMQYITLLFPTYSSIVYSFAITSVHAAILLIDSSQSNNASFFKSILPKMLLS